MRIWCLPHRIEGTSWVGLLEEFSEWTSRLVGKATLVYLDTTMDSLFPWTPAHAVPTTSMVAYSGSFPLKPNPTRKSTSEVEKQTHQGMEDEAKSARIEGREEDREFMFRQELADQRGGPKKSGSQVHDPWTLYCGSEH